MKENGVSVLKKDYLILHITETLLFFFAFILFSIKWFVIPFPEIDCTNTKNLGAYKNIRLHSLIISDFYNNNKNIAS